MRKVFFLSWVVCHFLAAQGEIGLELIPKGRPFRMTFADPREIRMSLALEGDALIQAAIGNYFSIFAIRPVQDPAEQARWMVHFGLEGAGFFTMRQAEKRFPLETADGLIGTYLEGKWGNFQTQLRFTHISAHLADGSDESSIAYSREFVSLRQAYVPNSQFQLYGGAQYLVNTVPIVEPWTLQCGGSYFLPLGNTKLIPFSGVDLKWKKENEVNPSFDLILGIALNNPPDAYRSFRFFYSYYTGTDPRGQFFQRVVTSHSFGIEMQI